MIAAAGNRVEALHRVAIGGYALPQDMAPGAWHWLDSTDLAQLEAR
jgi:16S rRNA pseudouridine516 synthase